MTTQAQAGTAPPRPGGPAGTRGLAGSTALTALAPATWGTTYLVTTEWLPPDRPMLSGAIRALPAGLVALALTRTLPRGAWWWRAAVLGTLNIGAFFALLFVAAYRLPGGVAATLSAAQPLVVAGLAFSLLGDRPTRWRLGWGVAGVVGVAVMVLRGHLAFDPVGILAGLAGTITMAAGVVLTKRWGRPVGVLAFTGWQLTAGGLLLVPIALAAEGMPPALDLPALGGYAWLGGVGTLLAYALWFRGLARLPVTALSFLPLLSPAVATVLGWAVLEESLTAAQAGGFGLALVSIVAAQLPPRHRGRLLPRKPVDTEPTPSGSVSAVPNEPSAPPSRTGTPWRAPSTTPCERTTAMRITVFGAAGNTGSRVVAEALSRGHEVTAVTRSPARLPQIPAGADARTGDAGNVEDVLTLSDGRDVVISATRPSPGDEHELAATAKALLAGLATTGARLLLVGGAATLTAPDGGTVLDDPDFPPDWRPIARACIDQFEVCRAETTVDWAYLSPPALLEPGARTGAYRLGTGELLVDAEGTSAISMEDLAVALLDEAEHPTHHHTRFTVAY